MAVHDVDCRVQIGIAGTGAGAGASVFDWWGAVAQVATILVHHQAKTAHAVAVPGPAPGSARIGERGFECRFVEQFVERGRQPRIAGIGRNAVVAAGVDMPAEHRRGVILKTPPVLLGWMLRVSYRQCHQQ